MSEQPWASDVPISMPQPLPEPGLVPMFGFTFTTSGLFHDLTGADHERMSTPNYAPVRGVDRVYDDEDVS